MNMDNIHVIPISVLGKVFSSNEEVRIHHTKIQHSLLILTLQRLFQAHLNVLMNLIMLLRKRQYATTSNFPFNLTSGSSDFNDNRAKKKPLMTTIKMKINRNIIMKKL